ncbi:hypothetical protein MATL_G00262520 [Megalops atlanticus]|uniref:Uncharacterized protein n=1 Tax=Megalops atlanticus TaxID=7932 RepID=A0A9D3PC81_MEGAT|nr:hypothetical protein MATL_G00262520 [Megalops atlanticus]
MAKPCSLKQAFIALNSFLEVAGCVLLAFVLTVDSYRERKTEFNENKDTDNIVFISCMLGAFTMFSSIFGLCGACKEKKKLLALCVAFMLPGEIPFLTIAIPISSQVQFLQNSGLQSESIGVEYQIALCLGFTIIAVQFIGMIMTVPLYCEIKKRNAARRNPEEDQPQSQYCSCCGPIADIVNLILSFLF